MAIYYVKKISGLVYRSLINPPTITDTFSASLNATINALGGSNHELVILPDTFLESIVPTVDNIVIRSASMFELPDGVNDPTVTIGPPPSSDYVYKINGGRSNIHCKGAFKFIGHSDFNFGTVSFQQNCNNISLVKLGDYRPFVISSDNAGDFCIYIFGVTTNQPSNITVDGVDIVVGHYLGTGIKCNNCNIGINNTISDCYIFSTAAIMVGKGPGIQLIDSDKWWVYKNTIGDGSCFGTAIALAGSTVSLGSNENTIEMNTISDAWDGLTYPNGEGRGINIYYGSTNNMVFANKISRCNRGITISSVNGVGNNIIYANIIIDSQVNGIDHTSSVDYYNYIINNLVIHQPLAAAGHGIVNQGNGKKAVIKNNIVLAHTDQIRPHNIQCIAIDDTPATSVYNIDIDNNLYLTTGTAYIGALDVINYNTFAEWKTALNNNPLILSKDEHSKNEDPLFVDAANGNYHLQPTSPCLRAGISIPTIHEQATPATDFDGNTIHFLPPSIGPYDGQGDTKIITADFTPTGYSVRGTAESPAKIKLAEHDLNVDLSGLTDAAPYIQVKAGSKRVAGFVSKGVNTYVKGSGGSSDGIFDSNFS